MDWLRSTWDFVTRLDQEIISFANEETILFYALYAGSIFAETGFVVTPFLPSETLIFSVGALSGGAGGAEDGSGGEHLNVWLAGALAMVATFGGDVVNMFLGRTVGRRFFSQREGKVLGEKSVRWSERYFERYGARTVFFCRFLPVVRTAVPFMAGMGQMRKRDFFLWNGAGAVVYAVLFAAGGYFLGKVDVVERNFPILVAAVGFVALLPTAVQVWHGRKIKREEEEEEEEEEEYGGGGDDG